MAAVVPRIEVNPDGKGLKLLVFEGSDHHRNYVDRGKILGDLYFNYLVDNKTYSAYPTMRTYNVGLNITF